MHDEAHYAKNIEIKNPLIPYGITKIIVGLLAVIFSVSSICKVQRIVITAIKSQTVEGHELYFSGVLIAGIASLIWFFWGLKNTILGIKSTSRIIPSINVPPNFNNYESIESALIRREMPIYKMPLSGPLAFARKFISNRVPFLKERSRRIIEMNIIFLKRVFIFLIFILVFLFAKNFIPTDFFIESNLPMNIIQFPTLFSN